MTSINQAKILTHCLLPILVVFAGMPALAQMTSEGIDCTQINILGIDKQENFRAGHVMIECGLLPGGDPSAVNEQLDSEAPSGEQWLSPAGPANILVSNRSCSSSSSCTKSESMVWADSANGGQTVVDNYNDHNTTYSSYSGTSYSTNGGATFTEIQPPPFATGHGTNLGDPIVVFNAKLNTWFAGDLVASGNCGTQGIGLWTSTNGQTWTTGSCPHVGTEDDRESMWVDNEPTSGMYGRMYISWDNYAVNAGALSVTHSDDGVTWSTPVVLFPNVTFTQRDVQLTGSPVGAARYEGSNSTVFVAAMDEGGGGLNTRQNVIYKSLDGGVTWTSTTTGPRFNPPGSLTCGYFAVVAPIWRHMGWGQPGVGPSGVVHYAYAGAGTNGDVGDIYYVRSTNNGSTWSTPIKLNTDVDNSFHTQWMPSLSADKSGNVFVSWYDRRAATSTCTVATDPGCSYERVGVQSTNNGASFGSEITISSAIIPQPTQTDPGVVSCYAGDYDYDSDLNGDSLDSWTDGRRAVGGVQVQDVNFAQTTPPGTINTVAGDGTLGYSGDGGAATSAELWAPDEAALDTLGNLYIADEGNCRIRKVTASTRIISTVAGDGTVGYSGDGGPATSAELNGPTGAAVDSAGNIYIADAWNNRVRKVTVATGIITTVAGNGTAGYSGDGGPATSAELQTQYGGGAVALDAAGNIYIADSTNNRIRKVTVATGIITTVAGNGTTGYSGDGGAATSAELDDPHGVGLDSAGNIYIADTYNNRIRKVTVATGIITTVAGDGTEGFSGDGGPATSAEIAVPLGVSVDSAGNLYIGDYGNDRARKVTASTGIISTLAGTGTPGYNGDGIVATGAELYFPHTVTVDSAGNVYIGDRNNERIRIVTQ
jgi:NHL repeat